MAGQAQNSLLKQVLGELLANQAALVSQLVEGKMIEIAKGIKVTRVNDGLQIKITGAQQVKDEKSHLSDRAYQRLLKSKGSYQIAKNGQSITVSISNMPIVMNYVKSNISVGDYLEYEFNHALLEELVKKWKEANPKQEISGDSRLGILRTTAGLNATGMRSIIKNLRIVEKAKEAARLYVSTYLSSKEEIEIYLNQLAQSQDFQANLGRSTSVGDTILEGDGTLKFPPRVIELKNYDLPSVNSADQNPSIRWLSASDQVLFGKTADQKNLYLKWLAAHNLAYNGASDTQFIERYNDNLGAYLEIMMRQVAASEEEQLKYIIGKQRKSTNDAGMKDLALLDKVISKIIIIVSPDGSKMMVTGPLKQLEEELSKDIESKEIELYGQGVSNEYVIFGKNTVRQSPAQRFASIGFEPRGLAEQIENAKKKTDPTSVPKNSPVPVTKLQSYLYYALLHRNAKTFGF